MTPYLLTLLIHIRTTPVEFPNSDTEHYLTTTDTLLRDGIIKLSDSPKIVHGYELTKLGIAWLTCILNTPVPTVAYIDQNGEVVGQKDYHERLSAN